MFCSKVFALVCALTCVAQPALALKYHESWNYANVREGAHIFWWLMQAQSNASRPLVIWLQGGPGASSTGFGNYQELGPLSADGKERPNTWLSVADLVFIDNPVGSGFSYVDHDSAYTNNVDEIAADLLSWAKIFFSTHPQLQSRPLYIFCESYGGKMSAAFTSVLRTAIQKGEVHANLTGVALGDSWISPMDYVNTWAPYLYAFSLLGNHSLTVLNQQAQICQKQVDAGEWKKATGCWSLMEDLIEKNTDNADFYNVLAREANGATWQQETSQVKRQYIKHIEKARNSESLSAFMNGPVRKKLGIIPSNVTWGGQSGAVFQHQWGDFMKPIIHVVDELLQAADLEVVIYNGQLDLICDTLGTELWLNRLNWPKLAAFHSSERRTLHSPAGQTSLFYKRYSTLSMYWIMRAGHMVPADAPEAALQMLQHVFEKN